MKFRAHETFSIRKGWLHKGMRHIINNPRVFVDKGKNPMDEFGLGSNMVKSLRYWLQATGLAVEEISGSSREQTLTEFGKIVWENDPYLEEDGTLLLIHYLLCTNKELAAAWYFFFNVYKMVDITQESFVRAIKTYLLNEKKQQISDRALNDDFDCIIKTYLQSGNIISPESNMECPLSELGLLEFSDKKKKVYAKRPPHQVTVNPLIILAVIIRENVKENGNSEIKISKLEDDPCNIGRVFNLDSLAVASFLDRLQNMGLLKVNRTAGLNLVTLYTDWTFGECVERYYESIND